MKAQLEKRVTMSSLGRNDVFGTSDCTIVDTVNRILYVIDYKHGYGIVDVKNNTQLIAYAIATLDTMGLWGDIDKVITTIVQPRAPHVDGSIRSAEYTVQELRDVWHPQYVDAVRRGEDRNERPVAGSHCKYCPARANCRARMELTLNVAYRDCPIDEISPEELEVLFREADGIKTHMEAIVGRALNLAREGHQFEDYKLVDSIVRAKCHDEKALVKDAIDVGVDESKLYERKLISMTKAKKIIPKAIADKHYIKPPKSTTLVPLHDNRPAKRVGSAVGVFDSVGVAPTAIGVFDAV